MISIKDKLLNRLTGYFGSDAKDYEIYETYQRFYVYPKAYGVAIQDEPQYYSILIVDDSGKIEKDRDSLFLNKTHI